MTLSLTQRIVVGAILVICLSSIPVTIFVHPRRSEPAESKDGTEIAPFLHLKDRIEVVRLTGLITEDRDESLLGRLGSTTSVRKRLYKALKNEHIKAVLLRINSPGGTVAASQELADAVRALRAAGKPVVATLGDVAASGGYYVAAGADRIVAEPGTVTGSIGVIMHHLNLQRIEEKLGVATEVIKSGKFKDIGSPNRPISVEERSLLQTIIADSYDQFVAAVASGRALDETTVRKLADGRIYSGRQALDCKLIDQLGGYEVAIAVVQKLARQRYKLSTDLPLDEGDGLNFLTTFLESAAGRVTPDSTLERMIPYSARADLNKLPLWLMQ